MVETTELFENFLIDIQKKHKQPIQVLAHSMGGVITMATINKNPELFHSVLFVGVPFQTGIGYLNDLHLGTSLGKNNEAFTPKVLFSHGSSYWTFPYSEEPSKYFCGVFDFDKSKKWVESKFPHKSFTVYQISDAFFNKVPDYPDQIPEIENWQLERTKINFYNANDWYDHKFGVFASWQPVGDEKEEILLFLQNALDRGLKFRKMLQYNSNVKYPKITVLSGKSFPTLSSILVNGPRSIDGFDYDSAPKLPGDGRIPYHLSCPDSRIPCKKAFSTLHHQIMLDDIDLIYFLLYELLKE